ncbi:MAG: AAA family ATPase [Methylobacteriaceae bacterium]|nr:AAA family ATPase [Methylobacteriaceae bacterium]
MQTLRKLRIEGFKSIRTAELEFGDLNVVIGANGSGKSNLISAFRLLDRVLAQNLQLFVAGDPDRFLFHGRKLTPGMSMEFVFGRYAYGFTLQAAADTLVFEAENVTHNGTRREVDAFANGHTESRVAVDVPSGQNGIPLDARTLAVYHFEDTSETSPARQTANIDDNRFLRPDAANLPAYLYWLKEKHPVQFRHIEEHVRLVAPFFGKFALAPSRLNENRIKLEWKQKGSDAYFDAYALSDGTLRFIALAVLLLQPEPPQLILLDEPELGLHPFALRILAEMLEAAATRAQVLLATQSVTLLNNFAPEDVIVAENVDGETRFDRLNRENLKTWLDDFSLGELWEKNVLGGRP